MIYIQRNVRKEANIVAETGSYLELDYYINDLNIAFEFQVSISFSLPLAPSSFQDGKRNRMGEREYNIFVGPTSLCKVFRQVA